MHYLYYCNSSYQLINVLNLHWHRCFSNFENIENYSADLIVLNAFDGAKDIVDILKTRNIFNNIDLVNRVKIKGRFHLFKTVRDILFPTSFIKNGYGFEKEHYFDKYDVICVPKFNRIVAAIWQLNKKARLHIHEDGLGTYVINLNNSVLPKSYKIFYKFNNYNRTFSDYEKVYLNDVDLYDGNCRNLIVEIPKIDENYKNELLQMFSKYALIENNKKTIYWLSQIASVDNLNSQINESIKYLEKFKENVIYCPHPRNKVKNIYEFDEPIKGQMWELKVLNMDINNICLVSSYSTALITPFILYKKQPYLLFTYKLLGSEINDKLDIVVERIANKYDDKNKIMVPKNISEYKECILKYVKIYGNTR